jgi:hypothetical protein
MSDQGLCFTSVYIIGQRDRGPVKIGLSGSAGVRLAALQISSPYELFVLTEFPGGAAEEEKLHKFFEKERLRGEWFRRSRRIKTFIDMSNCKVGITAALEGCVPKRKMTAAQILKQKEHDEFVKSLIERGKFVWLNP